MSRGARRGAAGPAARGAGRRSPRPAACTRPASSTAAGELLCLREDVGRHNALDKVVGWAFLDGRLPLARARPLRQRAALVRARPEGGGRGLPGARRGRRAVEPRRRARRATAGSRSAASSATARLNVYTEPWRVELTGVLLVGGASTRFGSPKALARLERRDARRARVAHARRGLRRSGSRSARRRSSSSSDLPVLDDGTEVRAAMAGVVAGCPRCADRRRPSSSRSTRRSSPPRLLLELADACADAAVPQTGPLPGAYRKSALPVLQRRLLDGRARAPRRARRARCAHRPDRRVAAR